MNDGGHDSRMPLSTLISTMVMPKSLRSFPWLLMAVDAWLMVFT